MNICILFFTSPECSHWSSTCAHSSYHGLLETFGWRCEIYNQFKSCISVNFIAPFYSMEMVQGIFNFLENSKLWINLFLKFQMDASAGIEAEYHHKNNRVSLTFPVSFSRRLVSQIMFHSDDIQHMLGTLYQSCFYCALWLDINFLECYEKCRDADYDSNKTDMSVKRIEKLLTNSMSWVLSVVQSSNKGRKVQLVTNLYNIFLSLSLTKSFSRLSN